MSDVAKWALLAVGAVALIALIMALPIVGFIDIEELTSSIAKVVNIVGPHFQTGRGIINNFLSPFGRTLLTGIMGWLVGKFALTTGIKITTWAYHYIFKG